MKKEFEFYVYIISNHQRTSFYIGFSNDIIRRIIEHKNGLGCVFTKKYKLIDLMYFELFQYAYNAINREKELKKWRREKKLDLIKTVNPEFKDLSLELFSSCGITKEGIEKTVEKLRGKYNQIKQ
ncbi:MAG: GIY-YIG nuclease family protein [Candidatus Falkowbacteria bacterium]